MRHAWLKPVGAALCAAGISGSAAFAGPAGMRIASKPEVGPTISRDDAQKLVAASRPSEEISPWRNPVKYMGATFGEMPIRSPLSWGKKSPEAMLEESAPKDVLSLDNPTGPPSPELFVALSQMSERSGNVPQARRQLQQALAKWPGNVDVLRAAARMEDRQGQLQLAESLYQQAVTANPQHAGALNDLGLCLARQGRLEESVATLERAIHLQPEKALYRNNVATVLVEVRQDQKALAHLSAVHGPAEANHNMGQLLTARGRAAEAVPYFQMALRYDPTLEAAQSALAQIQGTGFPVEPTYPTEGFAPGQAPIASPTPAQQQLEFPSTARSPEYGTSSYVPPGYYAPPAQYPSASVPHVGSTPRYLPPVGGAGPGLRR